MSNNNTMMVKRSEVAVWRVIDGEVVVLSPEDVSINALTGCGGRVWELIEKETTILEITRTICAEYEVETQQAEEDITEFISKLAKMKLVDIMPVYEGVIR
jgi:hypothetical protein